MAGLTPVSEECDFFTAPSVLKSYSGFSETVIEPQTFSKCYPGIISFKIPRHLTEFTSCAPDLRITVKVQKKGADGTTQDLVAADNVAIDAAGIGGLFSDLEVRLNDTVVESYNQNYQTIFFLKKLFGTSSENKKLLVQQCLYSRPTCPTVDAIENTNTGREARKSHTVLSRLATFCFPLETDLATARKLLPPNVEMDITLTHASNFARLHVEGNVRTYFVTIESCELIVRRFVLETGLSLDVHRRLMEGHPINYNFQR